MNNNKYSFLIGAVIITLLISIFVVPKISNYIIDNFISDENIAPIDNNNNSSTGVYLYTGEIENPIPSDPIGFVYYQKENGIEGQDYFEIILNKQEEMSGKTVEENNKIMWDYIYNNRYAVSVGNMKEGYIMFTTEKPIAENRDLFLGLEGSSKGAIDRSHMKKSNYDNEYLFDINELWAGGYHIDFQSYIKDGKIIIGGYVGQKDNTIKKITIVKK